MRVLALLVAVCVAVAVAPALTLRQAQGHPEQRRGVSERQRVEGQKPAPATETAEWVARQIDERDIGRDSRLEMTMRLYDRQSRVRERGLVITGLRAAKTHGDRVLVRFLAPGDIKGTGLLVWEHDNAEDERFLFLPALGRVRRIAGSEKQESFVGSDLSYEDIGGREVDEYVYAFVQRDATWTDAAGGAHSAWHLESKARDASAKYPRAISIVLKDSFLVVAGEMFNRRNEREKRYSVRRVERIDGIWTAMDIQMVNELQRTRTELVVTRAQYNVGLSEADFTRRTLEQGAR
jgi:hypothetical protein